MAIAKVYTGSVVGLEPTPITVEVNVEKRGFPSFSIVGLASKEVDESKLRIRSAITNSGFVFPTKEKITVNLAPANIPKIGSLYDLPIAIGILKALNFEPERRLFPLKFDANKKLFMGELSLDGEIKPVAGTAVIAELCEKEDFKYLYVPDKNISELQFLEKGTNIKAPQSLKKLVEHLEGKNLIYNSKVAQKFDNPTYDILLEDIQEQGQAKRGITIAAAGNHNISLSGPPGTGKSMIAKALISILPRLQNSEAREVLRIKSISGASLKQEGFQRPFRSPHHTISRVGMIGGGTKVTPGEITLAHKGVLFLDELNEYPRSVLESLRQPLEDREVVISRAQGSFVFPASFSLVTANNPCPCGYLNSNIKECTCKINEINRYQKRVSGPMWDRIDIFITMKEFDVKKIKLLKKSQNYGVITNKIKHKVEKARERQIKRYENNTHKTNAEQPNSVILQKGKLTKRAKQTLDSSVETLGISPRGYFRVIKVGRTIADLDLSYKIKEKHILEALSYRKTD